MMDVSDGIASDLRRIMERSFCGAAVEVTGLPTSSALRRTALRYGWNVAEVAAAGGEDYCLLATVREGDFDRVATAFQLAFRRPLVPIGRITANDDTLTFLREGRPVRLERRGYDHFA